MFGIERRFDAFVARNDDRVRRGHPGRAEHRVDLVLAEEEANAIGETLDHFVFAGEHRAEVQGKASDSDAVAAEAVLGEVIELARIEKRLAGNAADVEAR